MIKFNVFCENLHKIAKRRREWQDILLKKGWKYLGEGVKAKVYEHPSKPYVIKIYMPDPAYELFLDFAESQRNNPYVVKIKRKIFTGETDFSLMNSVALEKLIPIKGSAKITERFRAVQLGCQYMEDYFENGITLDQLKLKILEKMENSNEFRVENIKRKRRLLNLFFNHPLANTILEFHNFMEEGGKQYRWDIHDENIMIRPSDGKLVLTDPIFGR